MNYRSIQRSLKRRQLKAARTEDTFVLTFKGGRVETLKVPCANGPRLRWLIQMMNEPTDPTSQLIRSCESYTASCGGDECGLIRSSDNAEQRAARIPEAEQVNALRAEIAASMEPEPTQAECEALAMLREMPTPTEEIQ